MHGIIGMEGPRCLSVTAYLSVHYTADKFTTAMRGPHRTITRNLPGATGYLCAVLPLGGAVYSIGPLLESCPERSATCAPFYNIGQGYNYI